MIPGYELRINNPVTLGGGYVDAITADVTGWTRSIRANGGSWLGKFTITGELRELERWFYNRLGFDLQERSAGVRSWRGMIYSMDLYRGTGLCGRRRSLDAMYNAINATYLNSDDGVGEAGWLTQSKSIAQYGRREQWVGMDNFGLAQAQKRQAVLLAENAWPWPRTIGSRNDAARLDVIVCGYAFTANWLFSTIDYSPATDTHVSDYIAAMLADCDFLTAGDITSNTLEVRAWTDTPQRTWDQIMEMTELGDSSGNHWRAWVDNDLALNYAACDLTPVYYERGSGLEAVNGAAINPWTVQPGVYRDMTYPGANDEPGNWLNDHRDAWIEEVTVDDQGNISMIPADDMDDSDILTAQQEAGIDGEYSISDVIDDEKNPREV